jgi:hypothetical protein
MSGSSAMFAAIRRASSRLSRLVATVRRGDMSEIEVKEVRDLRLKRTFMTRRQHNYGIVEDGMNVRDSRVHNHPPRLERRTHKTKVTALCRGRVLGLAPHQRERDHGDP